MAPTKRKHQHHLPPSPPSSSPPSSSSFIPSISTVAVAQICLSVGYTSAEPSALRSLSSIASHYLQTLATSAVSIAASKGRTQSNLLDLIRAIEDLSIARGFTGASDPTRPLLKSSAIKDLRSFVRSVNEIPFARPLRRSIQSPFKCKVPSFAEAGRRAAHVPRWLPCFPEGWEKMGDERRRRRRWEDGWRATETEVELGFEEEEKEREDGNGNGRIVMGKKNGVWNDKVFIKEGNWVKELVEVERERIRFRVSKNKGKLGGGRRR